MVFAVLVPNINFFTLILGRGFIATSFLLVGDLLLDFVLRFRDYPVKNILGVVGFLYIADVILFWMTGINDASLNVLKFGNEGAYILNAMLGTLSALAVGALIEKQRSTKILSVLEYYGKNSLVILGTHQIIMMLLNVPIKKDYILNIVFCCLIMLFEIPVIY